MGLVLSPLVHNGDASSKSELTLGASVNANGSFALVVQDMAFASNDFALGGFASYVARVEGAFVVHAVTNVHVQSIVVVFGVGRWFGHV